MTGVFSAWVVAVALVAWRRGLSQNQFPPPYPFLNATVFMSIAALIARANGTVGGLVAWGTVLGLFLAKGTEGKASPVEDFSQMVSGLLGPKQ